MNEVLNYIRDKYRETGFIFISLIEITNKFGESARTELNELYKKGIVKGREGGNGKLIEYSPINDNYGTNR